MSLSNQKQRKLLADVVNPILSLLIIFLTGGIVNTPRNGRILKQVRIDMFYFEWLKDSAKKENIKFYEKIDSILREYIEDLIEKNPKKHEYNPLRATKNEDVKSIWIDHELWENHITRLSNYYQVSEASLIYTALAKHRNKDWIMT